MKRIILALVIVGASVFCFSASACIEKPNRCWDITGTYVIDFTCTSGCSGVYTHTMNITSLDWPSGAFTGTGYYNADPSYTWDSTGTLSGSNLTFTNVYTGSNPGYTVNATGVIASDGTLSGTATGPGQEFTWQSTSGQAESVICNRGQIIKWMYNRFNHFHSIFGMPIFGGWHR
jgi:hypothetical protein